MRITKCSDRIKIELIFILLLANVGWGLAQNQSELSQTNRVLKVGDKVPDFPFVNLINYPRQTAKLSDFKGKLLILDFWSTGCASCIESWPKLIKLQNEFKDQLQIILVNAWQDVSLVKPLIDRRRNLGIVDLTLPTVCKDSSILKLFPVNGVPHIVWIDKDGTLASITFSDVVNSKNISAFLEDGVPSLPQKNDITVEIDYGKPFFVDGNGTSNGKVLWQSILSKGGMQFRGTLGTFADSVNGYKIFMINQAIRELYRFAYSDRLDAHGKELTRLNLNRVEFNVHDEAKYIDQVNGELNADNLYIYQLSSSRSVTRTKLQEMMQEDLARYFGLNVRWVNMKKKCLVLTASDTSMINYKEGKKKFYVNDTEVSLNKVSVSYLLKYLEDTTPYYFSPFPFVDETGLKGKLGSIHLTGNINDYKSLDDALKKYNMRLQLKERETQILLISEPIDAKQKAPSGG